MIHDIARMLRGGDRRTLGRTEEVVWLVAEQPEAFPALLECLWSEEPVVAARAANAAEKVTREQPELLAPYKQELLSLLEEARQKELRWQLARMVPRLPLTDGERRRAFRTLRNYLGDTSSIVKTLAMQGLADLAMRDEGLRSEVREQVRVLTRSGTPAMRARGRQLLRKL